MNSKIHTYNSLSQFLHWLMVFLFIVMFALGWGRDVIPFAFRDMALTMHKSIGILLLICMIGRLIWSFMRTGITAHTERKIEILAAKIVHIVLYFLMFAAPITGWLMVSGFGKNISFFGLFSLPSLIEKDRSLGIFFKETHELLVLAMAGLAFLHVAAALYHHFIRKDDVLKRMIA